MTRQYYSPSTAQKIKACLAAHPNLKAREIGTYLGLTRKTVNSYLYSHKPGALGGEVEHDSHYQWHLKATPAHKSTTTQPNYPKTSTLPTQIPQLNRPPLLPDKIVSVELSLTEAFQGTYKTVNIDGQPTLIQIPPGSRPGTRIQVPHTSEQNLFCLLRLIPNQAFRLVEADVYYETTISSDLAKTGGTIQVPTLDGTSTLTIPAGTHSGAELSLAQQGWWQHNGERGSEYVRIAVAPRVSVDIPQAKAESVTAHSHEVIQEVFRSNDYHLLNDDEQSQLATMLEKAEAIQAQKQQTNTSSQAIHPSTILLSGWFWLVLLLANALIYGGLRLSSQFFFTSPVQIEQQAE